jgi:TldD protein
MMCGLAWAQPTAEGTRLRDPAVVERAMEIELQRALTELRLPDKPGPYLVSIELLDGDVATVTSSFGALASFDDGPYRSARVDVRVGNYTFDNGNFDPSFGERDGVDSRGLPTDDVEVALRRELWLALDEAYKGATEAYSAKQAAREGSGQTYGPDYTVTPPVLGPNLPVLDADGAALRERVVALTAPFAGRAEFETASAIGRDWVGTRQLLTTEGTSVTLPTGHVVVRVEATTRAADGAKLRDARWWVASTAAELPSTADMVADVEEMASWLSALRDAPIETDYLGPVLFEGPAAVELFRQLLAPEISGTPLPERGRDGFGEAGNLAPVARIGRRLLPEGWRVVDDPTAEDAGAGGYAIDFEGVAANRVELVHDGVVHDVLMSRIPREDRQQSTGHGRSLGTDRRTALPGAVTIHPARERSERRMRRKALSLAREATNDYVLVVRRLTPPAMAQDFQIAFSGDAPLPGLTTPLEVYRLYPDGREEPVRGLEFVGVDRRVLRDIAMAGRVVDPVGVMDTEAGPGRFALGNVGGLPASWSAPTVVITELELRGRGGGEAPAVPPPPVR